MLRRTLFLMALGLSTTVTLADTRVVMDTSLGKIELSLDEQKAPKTVENFVRYAEKGFYNGTVFHRVIPGFMVQGGGFTADMRQKPTDKAIVNEAANGLRNQVGTVAMARTAEPNSATAQFFINIASNDFLDHKNPSPQGMGYAVFGRVIKGMDVVNKIAATPTANRGIHQNVPTKPIRIISVTVLPAPAAQ